MKVSNYQASPLYAIQCAVGKGKDVGENKRLFSGKIILQVQDVHVLLLIFILSAKLLKTTTDGAVSQKSNEIHLKLDNNQLNGISIDTSGLLATWPEFWAIGLSFLCPPLPP